MESRSLSPSTASWLINLAAFWLAEIFTSFEPAASEPPGVLWGALAFYLASGAAAGVLWLGCKKTFGRFKLLGRPWLDESLLAFVPGLILLLPQLKVAIVWDLPQTVAVLVILAAACGLFFPVWRRGVLDLGIRGQVVYGWMCLAFWTIAMRVKVIAMVANVKHTDLAGNPVLTALAAAMGLIWGLSLGHGFSFFRRWPGPLFAAVNILLLVPLNVGLLAPASFRLGSVEGLEAPPVTPLILITMDTTRADRLSIYGSSRNTTPELARLLDDAVIHGNAISPSSWTLPAHASLFTGLFPSSHGAMHRPWPDEDTEAISTWGVSRVGYPLSLQTYTLAEWLRDNGYETAAFIANYAYFDPTFQLDQGFDEYFSSQNSPVAPRILRMISRRLISLPWAERYWQNYRLADQINRKALRWLKAQRTDRFFLFMNYMEPHLPWGDHLPGLRYDEFSAEHGDEELLALGGQESLEHQRRIDRYDSQIASMDERIGEFLSALRSMNLYDKALIIVTSDHGESFGERSVYGHGKSLNEAETRIPLIIKYPFSRRIGRNRDLVQLVDILPTISRELQIPFPEEIDGDPIGTVDHPILAELYTDPTNSPDGWHGYQVALYESNWKLIVRSDDEKLLFDLGGDPHKSIDIPPEASPWIRRQTENFQERQKMLARHATGLEEGEADFMDPELKAKLKALGYL